MVSRRLLKCLTTATVWAGTIALVPAWGDVLVKTDGTRIEGDIKREGDSWVVTGRDGQRTVVGPSEVKAIEITGRPGVPAEAGLASLRRSAEAQSDAAKVVERYKQFIESYKGTPAAEEAKADLAIWEERVAKGMMKIGNKWVDEAEAAAMKAEATDRARQAILALRESRMNDAEQLLAAAVAADPSNPTAAYLRGILLFRQEKLQDARRAFEVANQAAPNYGPTLNNSAVTAFRLNQHALALNFYEQAMITLPLDRGLLNNIAEALEASPDQVKNGAVWKRVKRKFDEQDAVLAQRLAQQGLYRWGATWVNQQTLNELKAAEARIKTELDRLAGEYDALASRLTQIDAQVSSNEKQLQEIELQSLRYDTNGNVVRLPLPNYYYTLRTQTDTLRAERKDVERRQASVRSAARDVQKQIPQPKYTGIQQLYAAEAAPVAVVPPVIVPSPGLTPRPTTRP